MSWKKKDVVVISVGAVSIFLGVLLNLYWQDVFEHLVNQQFILTNTSKTYAPFKKSRLPFYTNYYFFNWTNPSNMKNPNYKPEFQEVGPYKFWEKMEKINVTWNDNGTVTYRRMRKWYFDPEGSNGTLDDPITTINVIAVSATHIARGWSTFAKMSIATFFAATQQELYVTKKAREFLYDGYEDPTLAAGSKVPGLSSKIPFDRFGWFYQNNGSMTKDGIFNVETGINGMANFGKMRNWNHKNRTGLYPNGCNLVEGSGGDFWPPKRTKTESVAIFSPDLCRHVSFDYQEEVYVRGLKGYKYVTGPSLVDNGTLEPANECFCNGDCLPVGALNVSSCKWGAPAYVSFPHFHMADPFYTENIVGMNPDPEKHELYLVLEPNFGVPLEVAARLQVNLLVQPDDHVSLLYKVNRVVFPIFWFEQRVTILEETVAPLKILVHMPMAGFILSVILIITGTLCLLAVFYNRKFRRNQKTLTINKYKYTKPQEVPIDSTKQDTYDTTKLKEESQTDIKTNGDATAKPPNDDTHL